MASSSNGLVIPAAFKPPVDSRREFIKRELDDEDERIEVGVAIVGGGPAGLACANRLLQLLADEPELTERLGEVPVAVIEKGKACGAHNLSGAMMRPSGHQLLVEDGVVRGIRSGDKGRGKDGEPLGNFEPGADVTARATVLAEGTWGHLTGAAIREFDLARDREPQVWALGVKEVWEVPNKLDRVVHTLGWPLRYGAGHREFGGSWIYPMGDDRVSIGFVVGLDYTDATVSGHDLLQQFKTSRLVRGILEGGKRVAWGAKAIPEGGYWAMPKLSAPGLVLCGDSGGMVNVPVLKGIHYAIHAGILAADEIFAALK